MSALSVINPFAIFNDTNGQPLDAGYVYIGTAGLNPETNPITVYWDSTLSTPAAQPLRTVGGYVSRSGSPAKVYVNAANFSLTVKNSVGQLVWSTLSGSVIVQNASRVEYDPAGTGAVQTTVEAKLREGVSVKDFGAIPDAITPLSVVLTLTDNASRTNGSGSFTVPPGVYYLDSTFSQTGTSGYFKIQGAGRHRTMVVVANNTTGFDLNVGAIVFKDISVVSKAWYDAWVASGYTASTATDATGIGIKVGGRQHFENVVVYGFGGSGVQQPNTYPSIAAEYEHMRIQYCGKGLDLDSGSGGNITTTSRIKDVYISACTTGLYMRNWAHGVIDNLVAEYCTTGADISGCTNLDIRKWYFESNTTPYSLIGSTASIINETLVSNINPAVLTYDQGSYGLIPFIVGKIDDFIASFGKYALRGVQGPANARSPRDMFIELQNVEVPRVLKTTSRMQRSGASISTTGIIQQVNGGTAVTTKSHNIFTSLVKGSAGAGFNAANDVLSDDIHLSWSRVSAGVYDVVFSTATKIDELSVKAIENYANPPARLIAVAAFTNIAATFNYDQVTTRNGFVSGIRVQVWSDAAGALADGDFFFRMAGRLSDE